MNSSLQANISIVDSYLKKNKFLNLKIFINNYFIVFFDILVKLIFTIKNSINYKFDNNTKKILKKIYYKTGVEFILKKHLHSKNSKIGFFERNFYNHLNYINTDEKIKLINKLNFSSNNKIEITIIIAAYNNVDITLNCLLSILVFETKLKYEIILIDDHSSMVDYRTFGFKFRVIRNDMNFGFIKSNNLASKKARGKFLFFLNNDTIINNSTINELHKSYFFNEKVGAVGSMSVSNQFLIQEAGAFTFKSGTCWNYGRGENPMKSIYNFTKEVDYCSACSLFIKKRLFYK
jgi:hypothetical protein